jgi:hypothetical protein
MARYYDIDAANARLDEIRPLLEGLRNDRDSIAEAQGDLRRLRETDGSAEHAAEMQRLEASIEAWSVTLRDIGAGLIDFPALASGRPIWLCWRLGEDDIAWWHEASEGFASRRSLLELT